MKLNLKYNTHMLHALLNEYGGPPFWRASNYVQMQDAQMSCDDLAQMLAV